MKKLEQEIKEQKKKIERLNRMSEHNIQILPDEQSVEMYRVIHNEVLKLKEMEEKFAKIAIEDIALDK